MPSRPWFNTDGGQNNNGGTKATLISTAMKPIVFAIGWRR
jgi:hypothetical protein